MSRNFTTDYSSKTWSGLSSASLANESTDRPNNPDYAKVAEEIKNYPLMRLRWLALSQQLNAQQGSADDSSKENARQLQQALLAEHAILTKKLFLLTSMHYLNLKHEHEDYTNVLISYIEAGQLKVTDVVEASLNYIPQDRQNSSKSNNTSTRDQLTILSAIATYYGSLELLRKNWSPANFFRLAVVRVKRVFDVLATRVQREQFDNILQAVTLTLIFKVLSIVFYVPRLIYNVGLAMKHYFYAHVFERDHRAANGNNIGLSMFKVQWFRRDLQIANDVAWIASAVLLITQTVAAWVLAPMYAIDMVLSQFTYRREVNQAKQAMAKIESQITQNETNGTTTENARLSAELVGLQQVLTFKKKDLNRSRVITTLLTVGMCIALINPFSLVALATAQIIGACFVLATCLTDAVIRTWLGKQKRKLLISTTGIKELVEKTQTVAPMDAEFHALSAADTVLKQPGLTRTNSLPPGKTQHARNRSNGGDDTAQRKVVSTTSGATMGTAAFSSPSPRSS